MTISTQNQLKKQSKLKLEKKEEYKLIIIIVFLSFNSILFNIFQMSKKLDRARKKAETISDNLDMTDKERSREIKAVYKRAGLLAKKVSF